jgi:hypothetical protein
MTMTKLLTIMGFLGALALPAAAQRQPQHRAQPDDQIECPEIMRGLALTVRDVKGGIELEITTPQTDRVPVLREEARAAATELEKRSQESKSTKTMSTNIDEPQLPPMTIAVRDIATGVRVTVRPERTADLDTVRRGGRGLQEFWTGANCAQRTIPI